MTRSKPNSVTIRDVARLAGVSVATVSRFINQNAPVSEDVAQRLQNAMRELKYIPHAAARRLATNTTNTLGLLIHSMQGDFFAPLLSGVEEVASQAGFDLLISTSRRQSGGFPLPLGPSNTDGLLVFAGSLSQDELIQAYEIGFPVVLIHQSSPENTMIPCVTVENKDASCKIVEHLIQIHNRTKIIYLSGPHDHEDAYWREMGYREALAKNDLTYDPRRVAAGNFNRETAFQSIKTLIEQQVEFDAVFAGDDEAAAGVLASLQVVGVHVPEDISVAGFDDQRMSVFLNPTLTTVRAPTEEVGRTAARQLVHLIREGQADPLVLLPTEIILRRSCGCCGST